MRKKVGILGFEFDDVSQDNVLEKVEEYIESKKPHQIVTAAVYTLPILKSNKKLQKIFKKASLCIAESHGLVLLSRLLGNRLENRTPVAELFGKLLTRAEEKGWKIYLLGAEQKVVEKMAQELRRKYQKITIVGFYHGYFKKSEERAVAKAITRTKPDLLFIGIPSPKREEFVFDHQKEMKVPLVFGVGGMFDICAGKTKEAPPWIRKSYLEWLYRFAQEPKRLWKRYTIDIARVLFWTVQYKLKRLF